MHNCPSLIQPRGLQLFSLGYKIDVSSVFSSVGKAIIGANFSHDESSRSQINSKKLHVNYLKQSEIEISLTFRFLSRYSPFYVIMTSNFKSSKSWQSKWARL